MKGISFSMGFVLSLILLLVIVGIGGYLIYTNFISVRFQTQTERCRSIALSFCSSCRLIGKANECNVTYDSIATAKTCDTILGPDVVIKTYHSLDKNAEPVITIDCVKIGG